MRTPLAVLVTVTLATLIVASIWLAQDVSPPVTEKGVSDLVEWVKNRGRLMGYLSASDTMHTPAGGGVMQ